MFYKLFTGTTLHLNRQRQLFNLNQETRDGSKAFFNRVAEYATNTNQIASCVAQMGSGSGVAWAAVLLSHLPAKLSQLHSLYSRADREQEFKRMAIGPSLILAEENFF